MAGGVTPISSGSTAPTPRCCSSYGGDTDRDTEELREALVSYADTAIDDEDFVSVQIVDGRLVFIVADETTVGELIQATVAG